MAYIKDYKHDIFVSYAHVDNDPGTGAELGWVSTLIGEIRKRLAQRLGRMDAFDLWMDYQLKPNEKLTPQIMEALKSSAIILIIMSPGYLESSWCAREKDSFLSYVKERPSSDTRVFIVEYDTVEDIEKPEELEELIPISFWSSKPIKKEHKILGYPVPDTKEHEYYEKIYGLVLDIEKELKRLKDLESVKEDSKNIKKSLVFLAEVTDDIEDKREDIKNYLDQHGYAMLPTTFYPRNPTDFKKKMENDLLKCDLFVQLLSELPGKQISPNKSFGQFQFEIARDCRKKILQWRRKGIEVSKIKDQLHKEFINNEFVLAMGIEEFKRTIIDNLTITPHVSKTTAFVFVNMESQDKHLADKVSLYLSNLGLFVVKPISSGKPEEIRRDLEQNLMECDALIIIYGNTTNTWVREQLKQQRKIISQREQTLKALAVYEGPPKPKIPLDIDFKSLNIIDCSKGFDEERLKKFVENL